MVKVKISRKIVNQLKFNPRAHYANPNQKPPASCPPFIGVNCGKCKLFGHFAKNCALLHLWYFDQLLEYHSRPRSMRVKTKKNNPRNNNTRTPNKNSRNTKHNPNLNQIQPNEVKEESKDDTAQSMAVTTTQVDGFFENQQ